MFVPAKDPVLVSFRFHGIIRENAAREKSILQMHCGSVLPVQKYYV